MTAIQPQSQSNLTPNTPPVKNTTRKNENAYPMTQGQYYFNATMKNATGSSIVGGIAGLLAFTSSKIKGTTALIAGSAVAAGLFAINAIRGFNGLYEVKYQRAKKSFEKLSA